ncbi:Protein maelstrom 3 [Dufourea novaeangliae]|uniref:Protein maelstrom 3 n=1 Tax=Dufourea novaeangliae TaxID=178035 RepID=A0A154PT33_DUFNO|nr:Protein maelstrom 3 [Dufourea novaeangliae]
MLPEQKDYYESKAKNIKVEEQLTKKINRKTTLGEIVDEILAAEKKEQEFQENMLQYINSIIAIGIHHHSLDQMKFMLVHANWFYRREVGINQYDFCPAEFALAEFSFERGVENVYHEVVSAKIPLGWKRDALETSRETHKIPIEHPDGQSDFAFMYTQFVKVLESNMTGDKYPPLFTTEDLVPAIESLLRRMCQAAGNFISGKSMNDFTIYSLEQLFTALLNAATKDTTKNCSIPFVVAKHEFGKDTFCSATGLECDFHRILDSSQHCSMSIVKRWGFTICDHCCCYLDIPRIEGVHYPLSRPYFNSPNSGSFDIHISNLSINDYSKGERHLNEWCK